MADLIQHQLKISGLGLSETLLLPLGESHVGRHDADLVLPHFLVSRQHAILEIAANLCRLMDLNSANGTMVNGRVLEPNEQTVLTGGDVVEIGPYRLVYEQISEGVSSSDGESPLSIQRQLGPPHYSNGAAAAHANGNYLIPPGLAVNYSRYLQFLPGIYHTEFVTHFLAMLEAIWTPLEWQVENFDLYLDAGTSPVVFLPWLANWFEIVFDETWHVDQQRQLLKEAHEIYARRGTAWALRRILEIYIGEPPEITDQAPNLAPFSFAVRIPRPEHEINGALVRRIVDMNKPAHTTYLLVFHR
jgi:phage tail-like protein